MLLNQISYWKTAPVWTKKKNTESNKRVV